MKQFNTAQKILIAIGGTAQLVAGYMDCFWADNSTEKKTHKRPLKGRGNYGRNLKAHFDKKNFA